MLEKKSFSKDFFIVVLGQIISLFGNGVLRFALPLYLLNQTHSAALFGLVSALAFIPMILLCPIGGIVADRVNKKNVLVALDFATGALTLCFGLFLGHVDSVVLILVTMIILYGIQGAYQPAVQASVPSLVPEEKLMPANAIINLVNSLSGLLGPVLGGAVYAFWGITPILVVCGICFVAAGILESFIIINFTPRPNTRSISENLKEDLKESIHFILVENPLIIRITLVIVSINLLLSSLIMIGMPVIITQMLGFSTLHGNQFYGYAEGVMAAGSLAGGITAGLLSSKIKIRHSYLLLILCSATLLPIGAVLAFQSDPVLAYGTILLCCFAMLFTVSLFSIQMITYVQMITPSHLIGKIMSVVMSISMCASPLGQAAYGFLFEHFKGAIWIAFPIVGLLCGGIAITTRKAFHSLEKKPPQTDLSFES